MTATRIFTAAILIPAVIALVWWAPTFIVAVVAALVMLLALLEFFVIGEQAGLHGFRIWTGLCAIAMFYSQVLAVSEKAVNLARNEEIVRIPVLQQFLSVEHILMIFVLGAAAIVLTSRQPVAESMGAISSSSAALLFIVFPLSTLIRIHGLGSIGRQLLLFTLVLVWAGDTLAYFVGRSIGRVPMSPRLSPKKTWEGAIANLAGSILVALVFTRWLELPTRDVLVLAALANIAGQAGDLLESAYKRSAGVKDSGTILPGHGGILDRIDALILAAPVVWYYFSWLSSRQQ